MFRVVACSLLLFAYLGLAVPILSFYGKLRPLQLLAWFAPPLVLAYMALIRPARLPKSVRASHVTAAAALCVLQACFIFLSEMLSSPPSAVGVLGLGPFDMFEVVAATASVLLLGIHCSQAIESVAQK